MNNALIQHLKSIVELREIQSLEARAQALKEVNVPIVSHPEGHPIPGIPSSVNRLIDTINTIKDIDNHDLYTQSLSRIIRFKETYTTSDRMYDRFVEKFGAPGRPRSSSISNLVNYSSVSNISNLNSGSSVSSTSNLNYDFLLRNPSNDIVKYIDFFKHNKEELVNSISKKSDVKIFGDFGDMTLNELASKSVDLFTPSLEFLSNHVNLESTGFIFGYILTPLLLYKGVVNVFNKSIQVDLSKIADPIRRLSEEKAQNEVKLVFMTYIAPLIVGSLYTLNKVSLVPKITGEINVSFPSEGSKALDSLVPSEGSKALDSLDNTMFSPLLFLSNVKNKLIKWRWLILLIVGIIITIFKIDVSDYFYKLMTSSWFLQLLLVIYFTITLYYVMFLTIYVLFVKKVINRSNYQNANKLPFFIKERFKLIDTLSTIEDAHRRHIVLYSKLILLYFSVFCAVLVFYNFFIPF